MLGIIDSNVKIINDNIGFWVDAAQLRSYSGSSTVWRDISGNNYSGSLNNNPTSSTSNGGIFIFDGINDNISTNYFITSASFTVQVWLNTTITGPAAGGAGFEGRGIVWADQAGAANDFILAHNGTKASFFTGNPDSTIHSTTNINTGAWLLVTAIKNGAASTKQLYINTTADTSGTSNANILNVRPVTIGGNTLDNLYFSGSIATVIIYNKVLSATEITQNYNALKSRFGL